MSDIIRDHIINTFVKGTRLDGRKFDEYRNISLEYGISAKSAEGSARVKIGDTEVVAGVKVEVGTPFPDKPEEGSIMVNVELLPLASPEFESGPPSIDAIELSRVTDRVLRESGAIDFKKLCITKGEKAWMLLIDIYPINDAGNLFDACYLVALAALKNMKFPKLVEDKIQWGELTNKGLDLKILPMSCTILKIGEQLIVDPTVEEYKSLDARLSVGVMHDGKLCALQKGGEKPLNIEEIDNMINLAVIKAKELSKLFTK
jgi:exosome complex component RRP42